MGKVHCGFSHRENRTAGFFPWVQSLHGFSPHFSSPSAEFGPVQNAGMHLPYPKLDERM